MNMSGILHWALHPISSFRFWRSKRRAMSAWNRMSRAEQERHTEEFVALAKKLGDALQGTSSVAPDDADAIRVAAAGAVKGYKRLANR